jgi:Uncharacterized ACR, COG1993
MRIALSWSCINHEQPNTSTSVGPHYPYSISPDFPKFRGQSILPARMAASWRTLCHSKVRSDLDGTGRVPHVRHGVRGPKTTRLPKEAPTTAFTAAGGRIVRKGSTLRETGRCCVRRGEPMLTAGKAVKVSIYLSEGSKHHGASTYSSILDYLLFRGVSGATVLKGVSRLRRGSPYALFEYCRNL